MGILESFAAGQLDDSFARHSTQVRQDLAKIGQPLGPLDTLIAGHALEHQLTLVTGNTDEFSRVQGLQLESWNE